MLIIKQLPSLFCPVSSDLPNVVSGGNDFVFTRQLLDETGKIELQKIMKLQIFQFKVKIASVDQDNAFFIHTAILPQKERKEKQKVKGEK